MTRVRTCTVRACLDAASEKLKAAGCGSPRLDADILLEHVTGVPRARRYLDLDAALPPEQVEAFRTLIARREAHEPVAHLTGRAEFWSLAFEVSPETLIPRPETEILVEAALRRGRPGRILDLGTGTGCILLALLSEWEAASGVGVDANPAAAALAARNAARLGLSDRAAFLSGDWFSPCAGQRFDLIVSNPPYIADAALETLMPDVRIYEPGRALAGGPDGLYPCRAIISGAPGHLAAGGLLAVEIGIEQAEEAAGSMRNHGFSCVEIAPDLAGIPRIVSGIWARG